MEFLLGGDLLTSTIKYKRSQVWDFWYPESLTYSIYYWECTKNSKIHVVSDIIL